MCSVVVENVLAEKIHEAAEATFSNAVEYEEAWPSNNFKRYTASRHVRGVTSSAQWLPSTAEQRLRAQSRFGRCFEMWPDSFWKPFTSDSSEECKLFICVYAMANKHNFKTRCIWTPTSTWCEWNAVMYLLMQNCVFRRKQNENSKSEEEREWEPTPRLYWEAWPYGGSPKSTQKTK